MLPLSRRALALPASVSPYPALLALAVLGVAVAGFQVVRDVPLLLDEEHHYERIESLRAGEIPARPASCLHSYHTILAGMSVLTGIESIEGTRLLSMLVGLLCIPVAFGIVRRLDPEGAPLSAAQLFFLPILLPFFFLIYTDALGLLCVLLAVLLAWDDCIWGAALASIAGMLVRQTHVVWMLFAFTLPYVRAHGWRLSKAAIREHLRRGWLFLPGFAGFAVFVAINRGVAIGDRHHHPAFELHTGNVLFALFVVFVAFLPLHLANLPRILTLLRERRWWLVLAGAALVLFLFAASFDHPYNAWRHCLHNKVLIRAAGNGACRVLFCLAAVGAVLSLAVTELRAPGLVLLYPLAVLSLAPAWLVEPRYAIPALALFVLFRTRQSWRVEWMNLAWCGMLSLFILDGTFTETFFL